MSDNALNNVNNKREKSNEVSQYEKTNRRLEEIIDIVNKPDADLDKSLNLYEEAVTLGLNSSNLVTDNILNDLSNELVNDDSNQES